MPSKVWELRDIKVGSGGNPPDTIISRIPFLEMTAEEALEQARIHMRQHIKSQSSVEGIVIADRAGNIVARVRRSTRHARRRLFP
jgi:hypothetical protein